MELTQLTQAQEALMLHLQKEIESKKEVTNRLRIAEEDMEGHIAEIDRLEKLLKEKDSEKNESDEPSIENDISRLEKEKEELHNNVESLKSKTEEMAKSYEKEKEDLNEKIIELQQKLSQMEGEIESKKAVEEELQTSEATRQKIVEERDELLKQITDGGQLDPVTTVDNNELQAVVESLKVECLHRETENTELKETQQKLQTEVLNLEKSKQELENKLRDHDEESVKQKQEHVDEIKQLKDALEERQEGVSEKKEIVELNVADKDSQAYANTDDNELVKENELLKQELNTLKPSIESLTNDLQQLSNEKVVLQKSFEQREVAWEEEKNTLQQQLYDSCLEASSFKVSYENVCCSRNHLSISAFPCKDVLVVLDLCLPGFVLWIVGVSGVGGGGFLHTDKLLEDTRQSLNFLTSLSVFRNRRNVHFEFV